MTWKEKWGRRGGRNRTGSWPSIRSNALTFWWRTVTAPTACALIETFWRFRRNAVVRRRRRIPDELGDGRSSNVRSSLVNRAGRWERRSNDGVHSALVGVTQAKTILYVRGRSIIVPAHIGSRFHVVPAGTHRGSRGPGAWPTGVVSAGGTGRRHSAAAAQGA